jgi:hypothetical protein
LSTDVSEVRTASIISDEWIRIVEYNEVNYVRFQVLTAASMVMAAVRTSETSVDNYFTRQYIPEDNS